jgi:site-specific recombinase XerD
MIEDMSVRGFGEKTRNDYIRNVRAFAAFIGRSPDTATAEDLRRFQLHQAQTGVRPPSINSTVAALRFFFTVTLDRPDLARRLTIVREPRRLPAVLSVEEVSLLLQAAPGPKYKAAFATAYGAGLRVSEIVALKVGDVDSERMLLRVEQGKGRKDRHAMLSPQLLELLRAWWREGRRLGVLLPRGWLFPGRNPLERKAVVRSRKLVAKCANRGHPESSQGRVRRCTFDSRRRASDFASQAGARSCYRDAALETIALLSDDLIVSLSAMPAEYPANPAGEHRTGTALTPLTGTRFSLERNCP